MNGTSKQPGDDLNATCTHYCFEQSIQSMASVELKLCGLTVLLGILFWKQSPKFMRLRLPTGHTFKFKGKSHLQNLIKCIHSQGA